MKKLILALFAAGLLFTSQPAKAVDEIVGQTIEELKSGGQAFDYRKFTPEEMKIIEATVGKQPRPGDVGAFIIDNMVMIVIIRNDIVVYNGPPQPKESLDKLLKKGDPV